MRYFHFILLSLVLHFLTVSFLDELQEPENKALPIEVIIKSDEARTLVRETETKDINETDEEKKSRLMSERTKRFKKETRVKESGMSQNSGGGGRPKPQPPKEKGPGKIAEQFAPKSAPLLFPPGVGAGRRSAMGEKLPFDVQFGDFNALNTDRYLYYSFFARIEERIRPRWEMQVKDTLESLDPRSYRAREWLTHVEILLDKNGRFQRAILHKKSGLDGLDLAAIEAFRASSPFQNPPREMIKSDGQIHLYYAISVSTLN